MIPLIAGIVFFAVIMLWIGARSASRSGTYDDFLVAGRSHGVRPLTVSILATAIGASATVGLMDQAAAFGFPYFWFLGAAGAGLLVQGLTVTARIRETRARTFSEVVARQFGPRVHRVVSVVIVLGWTAIVAAQFKAAGSLVEGLSGSKVGYQAGVVLAALAIVCYTLPGGQHALIRTDALQFGMVATGIVGLLAFLLFRAPEAVGQVRFELLNDRFTAQDLIYHLLIVGGIYVISPNLFSRCFAARNPRTAKRAVLAAAPLMVLAGVVIAFIGAGAAASGTVRPGQPVFATLAAQAGFPWSLLLGISIFTAIMSAADTTLFVTASIVQHDLLKRESVTGVRLWVAGIAAAAVLLVLLAPGATLYTLLFAAYNLFAPAVVPLMFASFYAPRRLEAPFVWSALAVGMAAGLYGNANTLIGLFGGHAAAYVGQLTRPVLMTGFLLSSLISVIAVMRARRREEVISNQ